MASIPVRRPCNDACCSDALPMASPSACCTAAACASCCCTVVSCASIMFSNNFPASAIWFCTPSCRSETSDVDVSNAVNASLSFTSNSTNLLVRLANHSASFRSINSSLSCFSTGALASDAMTQTVGGRRGKEGSVPEPLQNQRLRYHTHS